MDNPDYIGYKYKVTVKGSAGIFDVKVLLRKVLGCKLDEIYVQKITWSGDTCWLVTVGSGIDCYNLKQSIRGVLKVGKNVYSVWVAR